MNKTDKYISQSLAKKIYDKAKEKGFELPEAEYKIFNGKQLGSAIMRYDTSELGEILPDNIISRRYSKEKELDYISYLVYDKEGEIRLFEESTEAEARGKMFYYLLENNLL